jgi:hypothetical protein
VRRRGLSIIRHDPRRRGRKAMLAVWCWCGRFYTVTPEAARRCVAAGSSPCPNVDCGKGAE